MKLHDYQHLKSVNLEKVNLQYETLDRLWKFLDDPL
jgi:hypothetical protein